MSQSQSQPTLVPDTPPVPSVHSQPLVGSYTWRSAIPKEARGVPCILGVDEAGRGPVLGPLVYGIAYCPASFSDSLKSVGFADSKALTAERRDALLAALIDNPDNLGWATQSMSPQDISAGMLRRRPHNLNAQSTEATVQLISGVLEAGVDVAEIFVDTVGDPATYAKTLRSYFPQAKYKHIEWTVCSKADAIYPIVGAASIAAKVTRDRWVEDWRYAEHVEGPQGEEEGAIKNETQEDEDDALREVLQGQASASSSRSPSPTKKAAPTSKKRKRPSPTDLAATSSDSISSRDHWHTFGSGYPSDPNTVAYLHRTLDPVFGWPGIVRFSWATVKTLLEERVRAPGAAGAKKAAAGGKRASRSASSKAPKQEEGEEDTPDGGPATLTTSALSATGSLNPPPGQPKGFRVKWADEPAQITSFFTKAKGGSSSTATPGSFSIVSGGAAGANKAGSTGGAGGAAAAGPSAATSREDHLLRLTWRADDDALRGSARVGSSLRSIGPGVLGL
ncbi:ribonuclease H-like protein [Jaminaea rosea]|uniref:Ribonuclease n=1 Tax=Jaminaea rosea TaxID=1569628 RepID=A0A316UL56_9BASI|nr:ribonuclease H-like protein [Jaminaea rosea]PWN25997.1 ribonuclease H-like protein [Jaminaea rosea]